MVRFVELHLAKLGASDSGDAGRFALSSSPYSGLFVVAKGLGRVASVRAQITGIGFATSSPESLITEFQRYRRVVEIVLGGIGVIALVIAALGICNALLAAVRERTREIGVLKAIGARNRDVRRMFLVEAAVPDLASYEQLLLGQILTIPSVVEAQSTFAIRTILSRGPLPLDHWRRSRSP